MNIAMQITFFRFLVTPLICLGYIYEHGDLRWISALLVILAGLSDWLDGYLARRKHQETYLGQLLDPLADKVMIISVLMVIAIVQQSVYVSTLLALIIIRDLTISSVRELQAGLGEKSQLAPSILGKSKTMVQIFAVILLVFATQQYPIILHLGLGLLLVSVLLSYLSLIDYLKKASMDLTFSGKKQ
ncbi:CDP-diacylglycerol--glycerol-3-phosphate 3-phosphatidyltransferase [Gammaproteobacteria bacterium]|nr:CDP-diacylglycerol--glycerol-3-phosphate 3-phosphatidyltransferase [Gammaproteobacteria bacterium]